jgi:hypothetical protein
MTAGAILAVGVFIFAKLSLTGPTAPTAPIATSANPHSTAAWPAGTQPIATTPASFRNERATASIDACTLLTTKDIQSIQGQTVQQTKTRNSSEGGFRISQCFYTLPSFTNSISLVITQRDAGPSAKDPKDFWRQKFRSEADADSDERGAHDREKGQKSEFEKERPQERDGGRAEENEESDEPLKIPHVGDEAFWCGNVVGGALYVLKGDTFIRIAIGGAGRQQTQINKTRALALKMLKHL